MLWERSACSCTLARSGCGSSAVSLGPSHRRYPASLCRGATVTRTVDCLTDYGAANLSHPDLDVLRANYEAAVATIDAGIVEVEVDESKAENQEEDDEEERGKGEGEGRGGRGGVEGARGVKRARNY